MTPLRAMVEYVAIIALATFTFPNFATATTVDDAARSPDWLRLLHFPPANRDANGAATGKSDITDPGFFLSPSGTRDPVSELTTIIQRLKMETAELPEEQRMSCRFPARVRWIRSRLLIRDPVPCPSFEAWKKRAEPDAIVFVYASQFAGNPASVFGHSFLRFDRAHNSGLLGFSLSFFAKTNDRDGFASYALKGLSGGYDGEYQFDHYFPKAHGYADVENRDIWEYRLNLDREQRLLVFEHAWELALAGREPYYFLNRNCAFQLLRLIEIGLTDAHLTSGRSVFVTPQESVKILDRAGLIENVVFRPSLKRKARLKVARLSSEQRRDFERVLSGRLEPEQVSDIDTSDAVVVTLASAHLSDSMSDSMNGSHVKNLFTRAATARSRLPASKSELSLWKSESADRDPLDSHASTHAQVGLLSRELGDAFLFGFRPALHALEDVSTGYLPNTQIVFLNTEFLIGTSGNVDLKRADLIDIKSLQSSEYSDSGLSWTARLAVEPERAVKNQEGRKQTHAEVAAGYSFDLALGCLGYALGGPVIDILEANGRIQERAAASTVVGTILRGKRNFVYRFEGKLERFLYSPFEHRSILSVEHSATLQLSRDSTVTAKFDQKRSLLNESAVDSEMSLRFGQNF